jgi:hypothetical protein
MSEKKYVLVFGESDLPGLKLAGPLRRRATVIEQPVPDIIEAVLEGKYSAHDGRSGFESYDPIYVVQQEDTEREGVE